jgi:DNA-binding IclR family transcriptional regulator
MTAQPNISKSVRRTFQLLELFAARRQPMTAAQIQHALRLPQPSARVLLKEIVDCGYLTYTMPARTYFPTARLTRIGDWLGSRLIVHEALANCVDALSVAVDETVSVSTATQGHVEVLYVRRASHPLALQVGAGMGSSLWRSAAGRALLSQLDEDGVEAFFAGLEARDAPRGRTHRDAVRQQIRGIRSQGYFIGYDILLKGVGAVCLPLRAGADGAPMVVTVAGGKDRVQSAERQILRVLRQQLREYT